MVEPVYPGKSRKRGAESFSSSEAFGQEEKLLGVRYLGLLDVRVRFQPKLCMHAGSESFHDGKILLSSIQMMTRRGQQSEVFCCNSSWSTIFALPNF